MKCGRCGSEVVQVCEGNSCKFVPAPCAGCTEYRAREEAAIAHGKVVEARIRTEERSEIAARVEDLAASRRVQAFTVHSMVRALVGDIGWDELEEYP